MDHLSGYGAYCLYLALKTHFNNDNFDYFKHGKVRASKETFESRNDKNFFMVLAKRYDALELRDLFIANILVGRQYSVELVEEEAFNTFYSYRKRRDSLGYVFRNELDKVFEDGMTKSIAVGKKTYPKILLLYLQNAITLETLILFNEFLPFVDRFNEHLGEDDILWCNIKRVMMKFKPFMRYDADKMKKILRDKIVEMK